MDWYRIPTVATMGPDWLDIPPAVRGHWLALMSYCALQENGGVIEGARAWDARRWDRVAAMQPEDAEALVAAGLAAWRDADMVVALYDPSQEDRASQRKESAAKAARARWDTVRNAPGNASRIAPRTAPGNAEGSASGNAQSPPRGEERRGEEERGESGGCADASALASGSSAPTDKDPPPEALALAEYLRDAIRTHKPDHKATDADLRRWARDIDLAIRRDRRDPDRVRSVIDFVHKSAETFWRPNILSGAKLREKFDALELQADRQLTLGASAQRDIRYGWAPPSEHFHDGEVKL